MTPLFAAAREIFGVLGRRQLHGCLIGGLAVQRWGEPRLTRDVDLTVLADLGNEEEIVDFLLARFASRRDDARAFALRHRVVLLRAGNEVELDVALGATPFEVETVERASLYTFERGCRVLTCSAEDLVIHKAVARRPRDIADIQGIVDRQYGKLDLARIRRWLALFGEIDGLEDVAHPFEEALKASAAVRRRGRQGK